MKTNQRESPQPVSLLEHDRWHDLRIALPRLAGLAFTYFLCAWLGYNLYETLQQIASYYVPIPVQDYWRVPENLHDYQTLHWGIFWKQHNEHRIIFPEIVFALDMLVAHGRMILTLVCSFVCYALTFGVLAFLVAGDRKTSFENRVYALTIAAILTFWQGSALALAQPFLLQWPMMQLGVAVSLFFLKRTAETADRRYLAATIIAAVVATYSSANALLLWPLLLAIALLVRLSKQFFVVLMIAAALFVGLYFIGYTLSGNANIKAIFEHPAFFVRFAATYLGMPFSAMKSVGFGIAVGLANFGLMVVLLVLAWRSNLSRTRPVVVLAGYYLFTLITIFITATGRMDLADVELRAARVNRYLTVPFMSWGAVMLLCFWMSARLQWRWFSTRNLAVLFSLFILLGTYKLRSWQQYGSDEFASYQLAALSIEAGLTDEELVQRIFPSPEFVDKFLPELKGQKLAIFGRQRWKWLGGDLAQFGAKQEQKLAGQIVYANPVEHGLEVVGWVNSDDIRDPYPRIVLANEQGKVVGFGRRPAAGFPRDLHTSRTPEQESWVAFVNSEIPSKIISVYAVTRHGIAQIDGVVTVPSFESASRTDGGVPVKDIVWHVDKGWAPDGIPVLPLYGWHSDNPAYSSWHGSDANVGRITGEFATPANACVVLPLLHGPKVGGLSSQLVDADTGAVLADFPFRDGDTFWSLWRVPVPPNVKHLRFVGTDNGHDWGQWLAVTTPMACK
jgi:hypothetical protein